MKSSKTITFIGSGILSTTLASILKNIDSDLQIRIFEKLEQPALESSNEKNNAGTGHAALCELNYTVEKSDGSIDIEKAKIINEQFEISKQFWAYLIKNGYIQNPKEFIRSLPHISFVQGPGNVNFLKRRYEKMSKSYMFKGMKYTENHEKIADWIPLIMNGRKSVESVAASKIDSGTDVNFGELTRKLAEDIEKDENAEILYNHDVVNFRRLDDNKWEVKVIDRTKEKISYYITDYIVIGAGGNAIPMLQKTKIPESENIGGFPISGAFLVCNNPEIVKKHDAKVYGKEPYGAPPMTVPHLDRRYINGDESLLFGPFAAIGPKFLKYGSNLDLFKSIKPNNILTMVMSGVKNYSLVKYSIQQVLMKKNDHMKELRKFVPDANDEDWDLQVAGKRVQVIKDTEDYGKGYIQFGTEVVHSKDKSVIALLGESPGASSSVSVALEVMENSFPQYMTMWKPKICEMIPSYGESLIENHKLLEKVRNSTSKILELE